MAFNMSIFTLLYLCILPCYTFVLSKMMLCSQNTSALRICQIAKSCQNHVFTTCPPQTWVLTIDWINIIFPIICSFIRYATHFKVCMSSNRVTRLPASDSSCCLYRAILITVLFALVNINTLDRYLWCTDLLGYGLCLVHTSPHFTSWALYNAYIAFIPVNSRRRATFISISLPASL